MYPSNVTATAVCAPFNVNAPPEGKESTVDFKSHCANNIFQKKKMENRN